MFDLRGRRTVLTYINSLKAYYRMKTTLSIASRDAAGVGCKNLAASAYGRSSCKAVHKNLVRYRSRQALRIARNVHSTVWLSGRTRGGRSRHDSYWTFSPRASILAFASFSAQPCMLCSCIGEMYNDQQRETHLVSGL